MASFDSICMFHLKPWAITLSTVPGSSVTGVQFKVGHILSRTTSAECNLGKYHSTLICFTDMQGTDRHIRVLLL